MKATKDDRISAVKLLQLLLSHATTTVLSFATNLILDFCFILQFMDNRTRIIIIIIASEWEIIFELKIIKKKPKQNLKLSINYNKVPRRYCELFSIVIIH